MAAKPGQVWGQQAAQVVRAHCPHVSEITSSLGQLWNPAVSCQLEFEAWKRPCMHSSKLVFLLSPRSPIPLSKLCWCQRMWSHCPGKVLGGGRKERRARRAWPSCPYAEFLLHLCCLMLQRFCRGHISELKMNCSQKICTMNWKGTSFKRIVFILAVEPEREICSTLKYWNLSWVIVFEMLTFSWNIRKYFAFK